MSADKLTFNRSAVRPMECLREGWRLIKDDYWLFLGITFVGSLLAGVAFGILRGPAMCGIHLTFLRREARQRVSFDLLLRGFDYFVQSLIATLLMMVPALVLAVPASLLIMLAAFASVGTAAAQSQNEAPDPTASLLFVAVAVAVGVGVSLLSFVLGVLFFFVYPLIVDRGLTGVEALKLSARAGLANFGGILGVMLLMVLLALLGLLACYVGVFFMYPLFFALIAVAYRQVFPPEGSVLFTEQAPPANWPETGERFSGAEQTGVQRPPEGPIAITAPPA